MTPAKIFECISFVHIPFADRGSKLGQRNSKTYLGVSSLQPNKTLTNLIALFVDSLNNGTMVKIEIKDGK